MATSFSTLLSSVHDTINDALMPTSVLVLYPPPGLSAARVARDLAQQQYSPHPLRWLNLQEDPSDSIRSSTPNRPSAPPDVRLSTSAVSQPPHNPQTVFVGQPEKILFSSTAITPGPSTRRLDRNKENLRARKSSRSVTFDLTHDIAAIPIFEASLDDVVEDPTPTAGKIASNRSTGSQHADIEHIQPSKKRKYDSIFVRQDPVLQQSATNGKIVQRKSDAANEGGKASCFSSKLSRSTLPSFAFPDESSQEQTGRKIKLDDVEHTRDPKLLPDAYNMDADDEDSHPVRKTLYRGSSTTTLHRHATHEGSAVRTRPSHSRPTPNTAPASPSRQTHHLVEKDYAVPESPLHDITNFSYAGAVDSQAHSSRSAIQDNKDGRGSHHNPSGEEAISNGPAGTQCETQFSGGSQSWQAATYQTYRPAASGLGGVPLNAVTSTLDQPASFALQHDLPILNISSLSHMSDLRDGGTDADAQHQSSGVNILAVVFEVGELKDIPRRRNENAGMNKGQERHLRLCNIKICQPNTGGYPKMTVIDVSVWGDMADQISNGDYRLVKGDVVWLQNLQFKSAFGGQDCSLQTRSAPASAYRIFYRTYPRIKPITPRAARQTAEEAIDEQLRAIEKMKTEPGIKRALQLASWIAYEWQ
ncbi:hypothetical protein QFC20_002593 [Naganishia adeliensis]|uniref:Uncharacterized protein n=1 Tax=Naganishia adeliensis TaxID=92952 RepID=A0ACC2WL69_9TREE|nr:hypothetical protein QFC20_002593 [Naganishia adeliensis]